MTLQLPLKIQANARIDDHENRREIYIALTTVTLTRRVGTGSNLTNLKDPHTPLICERKHMRRVHRRRIFLIDRVRSSRIAFVRMILKYIIICHLRINMNLSSLMNPHHTTGYASCISLDTDHISCPTSIQFRKKILRNIFYRLKPSGNFAALEHASLHRFLPVT